MEMRYGNTLELCFILLYACYARWHCSSFYIYIYIQRRRRRRMARVQHMPTLNTKAMRDFVRTRMYFQRFSNMVYQTLVKLVRGSQEANEALVEGSTNEITHHHAMFLYACISIHRSQFAALIKYRFGHRNRRNKKQMKKHSK